MNDNLVKKRLDYLDILRSLAMIFVIVGHQIPGTVPYFVFTSPIKIPLFFVITGFVFNGCNGDILKFLKKIVFRLIIPWILLSLIFVRFFYYGFFDSWSNAFNALFDFFVTGSYFWYLPCCIIAECILFLIQKFLPKFKFQILAMVLIAIIGFVLAFLNVKNYCMFITALIAQLYLLIGLVIKQSQILEKSNRFKVIVSSILLVLYLGLGVISLVCYPNNNLDVHLNVYYNYLITIPMIVFGCASIFLLFSMLKNSNYFKIMKFIGRNTLVFYIDFDYCNKVINYILKFLKITVPENILINAILLVLAMIATGVLALFLNKFLPEFVGKPRKKQIKMV